MANYGLLFPHLNPEKYNSTASTGMYRSVDFPDKSVTGIAVVPNSRCGFGDLSALLHLIEMNRSDAQALIGKLLIHSVLRNLPGSMDVVGAEVQHHAPVVVCPRLNTICSRLTAGLIAHDQPKSAQRNRW